MRNLTAVIVLVAVAVTSAKEEPKAPAPAKQHEWLKQLEGEWVTDGEGIVDPNQPPIKCKGTESTKMLGGLWAISEMKNEVLGQSMTGIMTIGYDVQKKVFIGTFVCSMCDSMFKYEGKLEGQVLTLETEGPNPATGKVVKMRDSIEIKDKNHKLLTSYIQGEDGKWTKFMTMTAKRK